MKYLANTFSPQMLGKEVRARVTEITRSEVPERLVSVVSHEVTAKILSALLGREVTFNRTNLMLIPGDTLYAVIPSFRASEAREFTAKEVTEAGYRAFFVECFASHMMYPAY